MKTATARTADSLATSGRKVHLVVAGLGVACRTGVSRDAAPGTHLADLSEDGGRDELLATFHALAIVTSQLCRNCFSAKLQSAYARTLKEMS